MNIVKLGKGRDSSLLRHHPWIFSGAVAAVEGTPGVGDTVTIADSSGKALGVAAWSPASQIRARMWSFDPGTVIDADFIRERLRRAIARRAGLLSETRTACRLVYAEADGFPGLIVDRYGDYLSCQFLSSGAEFWRDTIIAALAELSPCLGIYERSDVAVRKHEGLEQRQGLVHGQEPPQWVQIQEQDRLFMVSIQQGHKTGYYLDQFDNRSLVQQLSAGKTVLNCFSYTGGFGIAALKGGATHVTNVDSSAPALELAGQNLELNGFDADQAELVQANVFEYLRELKASNTSYDLIVLDPPKFAETKHQFKKAARAYKDIALQAAQLLNVGGTLVSFSCSGAIDPALFQKITADALLDAGREGRITHYLHQAEDHPVALPFPEALYLKGLVCVLD
ncbi:23S rRNA methyltransferase [Pseudohongiella acticola]|uniref:23S rRNA methyltransferase n=1 Tax=Pseudohongiella acticola TaxID=1524254 RepID=A0A1E8CFU1_9GAMM|nr:class I SAM-dependent methyltransferase [Pseudohongiella acticola]OFE11334.1 23S rRNA methyltransferase [Pseudohongiella acticola]